MVRKNVMLYCSFCGKDDEEVVYLIAGPTVFICNECVELCREIGAQMVIEKGVAAVVKNAKPDAPLSETEIFVELPPEVHGDLRNVLHGTKT